MRKRCDYFHEIKFSGNKHTNCCLENGWCNDDLKCDQCNRWKPVELTQEHIESIIDGYCFCGEGGYFIAKSSIKAIAKDLKEYFEEVAK